MSLAQHIASSIARQVAQLVALADGGIPDPSAPAFTSDPVISGNTWVGQTLTTTNGTGTGYPSPTFTYQWKRNGSPISGAISQAYLLVAADDATNITCTVSRTNSEGSASATSAAVGPIKTAPENTVTPTIDPVTAVVNSELTCNPGTWTGTATITFAYQWLADDVAISGATSSTYTPVVGDVGAMIRCAVTASNGTSDATETTAEVGPVTAAPLYRAETLAYQARIEAEGGTLDEQGLTYIDAIYEAAADEGVTVSGWAFGRKANPDINKFLNLDASGSSQVPEAALNPLTTNHDAMLGIRVDDVGEGFITHDNEPFFTNDPNYSILLMGSVAGDPDLAVTGRQNALNLFDQGLGGTAGNFIAAVGITGVTQFVDRPSTSVFQSSDANSESNVRPLCMWFDSNASSEWKTTQIMSGALGTYNAWNAPLTNPLRIARHSGAAVPGGDLGFALFLRFDGALTDDQRSNIFTKIYQAWRQIGRAAMIIGNSVTISGVSHSMKTWPKNFLRYGVYNSTLVMRMAAGGRRLPYFAPTGYALPGLPADADISTVPLNLNDKFAANVLINDDQQNMIASGQPFASFLHCHNAFVSHLAALPGNAERMIGIMCEQMAHAPWVFGGYVTPLSYAEVVTQRTKFLTATQAARAATLADFNFVPTTIAPVYSTFNLGWDTPDDGNPPDPDNDLPNGDTSLLADPQHANDDGHGYALAIADYTGMSEDYIEAYQSVELRIKSQPSSTSKPVGATHTFTVEIGGIVTYQWQINTGSGWSNIGAATSSSYTTPTLVEGDDGNQYRVVITSSVDTVTSDAATLTIAEVFGIGSASVGSTFVIG